MTEMTHLIINGLRDYYKIEADALVSLPIGADMNASVYKVQEKDKQTY
jgi:chitinase